MSQAKNQAAQGSMEYLLLIGGAVLVAVLAFAYFKVYKPRREM